MMSKVAAGKLREAFEELAKSENNFLKRLIIRTSMDSAYFLG